MRKMFRNFFVAVIVLLLLSVPAWSAYTFTLDYATNDMEEWTFVNLDADTSGTLTFRNTNYRVHPAVFLVPNDVDTTIDNTWLGTPTATTVVVNKNAGVAGAGRIIVIRRR